MPTAGSAEAAASTRTLGRPSASPSLAVTLGTARTVARRIHSATASGGWAPRKRTDAPGQPLQPRPQRAVADDDERGLGPFPADGREGPEQDLDALLLDQPADEQDRVRPARPGREAGEIDAVIMDRCALGRIAARDRLPPQRFGDGEEEGAAPLQRPLAQRIMDPGRPAREKQGGPGAGDVVAAQGGDQRHAEPLGERQRTQPVRPEMGVDQHRRIGPDPLGVRPQQHPAGQRGGDIALVLPADRQRLVTDEARRLRHDEGLRGVEQGRAEDRGDGPGVAIERRRRRFGHLGSGS